MSETTGDNINDAIWARNAAVEQRLNVKLNYIGYKGNNSNINSFVSVIQNDISAGNGSHQFIGVYSSTAATLAVSGLLQDIAAPTARASRLQC